MANVNGCWSADLRSHILQGKTVPNNLHQGPIPETSWRAGLEGTGSFDRASARKVAEVDDLARDVYGILGVPIDLLDQSSLLRIIDRAVADRKPFLVSTPNVHFLMTSRVDEEFRNSLLLSGLCLADGMPIVWISRLLGVPVPERLAGSDLFDTLRFRESAGRRLRIFLFGGGDDVAATVCKMLNDGTKGMECVGVLNPGFGSVDDMSTESIIEAINSSAADFLSVSLSAKKGQKWLMQNHHRLQTPVRLHFGAAINFQSGKTKRAPTYLRSAGLEWAWRIKEEPYLWPRYWNDGRGFLRIVFTCVLPLVFGELWRRLRVPRNEDGLVIVQGGDRQNAIIALSGVAIARHVGSAISSFRKALMEDKQIVVDLANTQVVDPRFFGLFLMVHKQLAARGKRLSFTGVTPRIKKLFELNGFEFLLHANA